MAQSNGTPKRYAIYTRKSSEEGLEQNFNSLHAQRQACEAYVKSQAGEGWRLVKTAFDDGGFSGATMDRPALKALLDHVKEKRIDVVVVYKVDRLTRSLADFAKIVEIFDAEGVSFVAVTQQFNTTTSMGRLTLNVLLSFAQFEREVTGRTHPRQDCGFQAERDVDGRHCATWIRPDRSSPGRKRGGRRDGAIDIPALSRTEDPSSSQRRARP